VEIETEAESFQIADLENRFLNLAALPGFFLEFAGTFLNFPFKLASAVLLVLEFEKTVDRV